MARSERLGRSAARQICLPAGVRVTLDGRVRARDGGRVLTGGSPWSMVRLAPPAADFVRRLAGAGTTGLVPSGPQQRTVADLLLDRGMAHPLVEAAAPGGRADVVVVVPAYRRVPLLEQCLRSVAGAEVVVVDDASDDDDLVRVVRGHGARLVQHQRNRGPAAARNTGLAATTEPFVAFLDSDCAASPGWLEALLPLFDDPRVGAVAPRVVPYSAARTALARYERARSALDLGPRRELVRPGGPLGFLPSAALVVRREALAGLEHGGFDPRLRVGEDVDLVWRLADAGWHVRLEPSATVAHAMRLTWPEWIGRRLTYGTSAAALAQRHPGRLVPLRVSGWNLAAAGLLLAGRPVAGASLAALGTGLTARRLAGAGVPRRVVPGVLAEATAADALAICRVLRREWWPVGLAALATGGRGRLLPAGLLLAPLLAEWLRQRPDLDPLRYTALRLVDEAAYGTGVQLSAVRAGRPGVLVPGLRRVRSRTATAAPV